MSLKILIVEDEPIISEDIAETLTEHDYKVVGQAFSSVTALDMLINRSPEFVLLDISIKGNMDGIDLGNIIRTKHKLPFIYITSFSDTQTLDRAKQTMPYGYIVKPFKDRDIISAIEMAMYRYTNENNIELASKEKMEEEIDLSLTKMEYQVIHQLWTGKTYKEIGEEMFLSVNTIKTHTRNIYEKFKVQSRSELLVHLRNI